MNKKLMLLAIFLAFYLVGAAAASGPCYWMKGQMKGNYGTTSVSGINYYNFTFQVAETNETALAPPVNVTVFLSTALSTPPGAATLYNFTGWHAGAVDLFPFDSFVVVAINIKASNGTSWVQQIIDSVKLVAGFVKGIADTVAGLITQYSGVVIPSWAVTVAIVAISSYFFIKNIKTWSIVLLIVVLFFLISGTANLIRLALGGG